MSSLLVSVKSPAEARLAVGGGADLVDVKDPSRGSLGRADDGVVAAVLEAVAGARPVSAALGELRDWDRQPLPPCLDRLAFVKWGLADAPADWGNHIDLMRQRVEGSSPCRVVLTAYADHERAGAPQPWEAVRHAVRQRFTVLLVGTCLEDGTSLVAWLSVPVLRDLVATCRDHGVRVALAGSLTPRDVEALLPLRPDWFAVRGAACLDGRRGAELDGERVRRLVKL